MFKILGDLILKVLLSNVLKSDKHTTLRTILVVVVILIAMGLLQYSDAMLNVHKAHSINEIEKPALILEQKLNACVALLENTKGDLEYCRVSKHGG